jgi:methionyl-tRNA formyltransferase
VQIAVAATPEVAIPTLELLLQSSHDLVCIITQPDRPSGRGLALKETPVALWAKENGIKVYKPANQTELVSIVENVDLVLTIGYGVIIKEEILNLPRYGFINLHFSLLPKWRGAAPVQRAIEAGDLTTGVTVFKLDKGMDTGPIYLQKEMAMPPGANSASLLKDLSFLGSTIALDAIAAIETGEFPAEQPTSGSSRAEKLSKDEGRIDWKMSAAQIDQKIRAFYPAPGAWTTFRDEVIKIDSVLLSDKPSSSPGEILVAEKDLFVSTTTGSLQIISIKPAGKPVMTASAWLNGARITSQERFV